MTLIWKNSRHQRKSKWIASLFWHKIRRAKILEENPDERGESTVLAGLFKLYTTIYFNYKFNLTDGFHNTIKPINSASIQLSFM